MIGKFKIKATLIVAALALGTGVFAAAPAFASGPSTSNGSPVTAQAEVGSYITMSGLTGTIEFGLLVANTPVTLPTAEVYSVSTNDTGGYSLSLTPGGTGLVNTTDGTSTIPNSLLTVTDTINGNSNPAFWTHVLSGSPVTLNTANGAGMDAYSESWTLATPALLPNSGQYQEQFTYTALAS